MRISDAVSSRAVNPMTASELEEIYNKRRKEALVSEEEALKKVEEVQNSNTQSTFKMMDHHNEVVKKSQELNKKQAQKRAIEHLAEKRAEEHTELLAEMAVSNAERRDLLEASRLKEHTKLL